MPASAVRTFTDPDAYHAAIRNAHTEGIVTGRGNFRAEWTRVRLDRLSIQRSEESLPRVSYSTIDPKVFGIIFPICPGPSVYINGLESSHGDIIVYRAGSTGHNRSSAACQWGAMALTHEDVAAAGQTIVGRELIAPALTYRLRPPPAVLSRLLKLHEAAAQLAKNAPDILAKDEVARAIEQGLVHAIVTCVSGGEAVAPRNVDRRRAAVMRRLEEALLANSDRTLCLAELCAAAAVSARTLLTCCHEHLGMGPIRYLWLRRMHLARRALRLADPWTTTVTEIATDYGFWELGRFSVAYRALFGETPSASLRRPPEEPRPPQNAGSPWQFAEIA